jgi:hypothetical protein
MIPKQDLISFLKTFHTWEKRWNPIEYR